MVMTDQGKCFYIYVVDVVVGMLAVGPVAYILLPWYNYLNLRFAHTCAGSQRRANHTLG